MKLGMSIMSIMFKLLTWFRDLGRVMCDGGSVMSESLVALYIGCYQAQPGTLRERVFSTPCRGWIRGLALPPLLCHKEPAPGTQSPLIGLFLAFCWFFMA